MPDSLFGIGITSSLWFWEFLPTFLSKKTLKVKKCNRRFDILFSYKPPIKVNSPPSIFKECLTITEISENINQDSLKNTIHNSNALFFNKIVWHWLQINDEWWWIISKEWCTWMIEKECSTFILITYLIIFPCLSI